MLIFFNVDYIIQITSHIQSVLKQVFLHHNKGKDTYVYTQYQKSNEMVIDIDAHLIIKVDKHNF